MNHRVTGPFKKNVEKDVSGFIVVGRIFHFIMCFWHIRSIASICIKVPTRKNGMFDHLIEQSLNFRPPDLRENIYIYREAVSMLQNEDETCATLKDKIQPVHPKVLNQGESMDHFLRNRRIDLSICSLRTESFDPALLETMCLDHWVTIESSGEKLFLR